MKPPKLSLARAMILVALIAFDIWMIRESAFSATTVGLYADMMLVMANVLAFGLVRIASQPDSKSPILLGFLAFGLFAMASHLVVAWATLGRSISYYVTGSGASDAFIIRSTRRMQSVLGEKSPFRSPLGRAAMDCIAVLAALWRAILLALPQVALGILGSFLVWFRSRQSVDRTRWNPRRETTKLRGGG